MFLSCCKLMCAATSSMSRPTPLLPSETYSSCTRSTTKPCGAERCVIEGARERLNQFEVQALVADFLERKFDDFFRSYEGLLKSENYATKRQSLRLLCELLMARENQKAPSLFAVPIRNGSDGRGGAGC
mgnify:CR=1 FL=1